MSATRNKKHLIQEHPDFCVLVDAEGRIVADSAQPSHQLRSKGDVCHELLGLHHSCPCNECFIRLAFETGLPVTEQLDHPDMGFVQVRVHPLSGPDGKELASLQISSDRATFPSEHFEKAERQGLESLQQAVFDIDLEGRITFANRPYLQLFGFSSRSHAENNHFGWVIPAAGRSELRQLFSRVLHTQQSLSEEFIVVNKNGDKLAAIIHLTALTKENCTIGVRGLVLDITRQKNLEAALDESETRCRQLTHYDQLTGLPNRTLLTEWLGNIFQGNHLGRPLTVMVLDLDRFKQISDFLGDECGNQVLGEITQRLRKQLRSNDILARLNDDEFVLVYSNISNQNNLSLLAQRLLDALQEPMQIGQHTVYQTASIGIVTSHDGEDPATLLRQASMAMNDAKLRGGNRFVHFSLEMQNQLQANFFFEKHMRDALQRQEFYLHYQPQVDLKSGRVESVEALLRWAGPPGTPPSPETFIKVAEESGLIHPLGDFVLREACTQNLLWQQNGLAPIKTTVNISAKQFSQTDFVDKVLQILADTGLAPQWLELEITESAIMTDIQTALDTMLRLQQHGVHFAVDDFGTGHSSLNYLRQLALNKLKIDRSFVQGVPGNRDNEKLIDSILSLARSFNLQTVAEGIETPAQLEYLQQLDCDLGQGYLFSRPVAPDAIPALLSTNIS